MPDARRTPTQMEWSIGHNRHNQPVRLVLEGGHWGLIREAANQRDESARIELNDYQVREIAAIVGGDA